MRQARSIRVEKETTDRSANASGGVPTIRALARGLRRCLRQLFRAVYKLDDAARR
jgi:hypothetical protein